MKPDQVQLRGGGRGSGGFRFHGWAIAPFEGSGAVKLAELRNFSTLSL